MHAESPTNSAGHPEAPRFHPRGEGACVYVSAPTSSSSELSRYFIGFCLQLLAPQDFGPTRTYL